MNTNVRLVLLLIVSALITGCASKEKYDSAKSVDLKKFSVPEDSARIYFKTGVFLPVTSDEMEHFLISSFRINEQEVGTTHLGQVLVVNLKPGTYKLSWIEKNSTSNYLIKEEEVKLNSGDYIIASSNLKQSGADQGSAAGGILGIFFGLVGTLVAESIGKASGSTGEFSIGLTENKNKITVSQFVKPMSCPTSFCINE